MDLVTQEKIVRLLWGRCPHDEPLKFFWEHQREISGKRPTFLKVAIQCINRLFLRRLNDHRSLDKSFRLIVSRVGIILPDAFRPRFCSIKDFFSDNPDTFPLSVRSLVEFRSFIESLESSQSEPYESHPKGFIPLPDAEIGGCARNDSLIAPAI